jgi:hypothetical protein
MTETEMVEAALKEIFVGAESYLEDWIDEEGEYTEEEFEKIRKLAWDLLDTIQQRAFDELP